MIGANPIYDTELDPYFDIEDEILYGQRKERSMLECALAEKENVLED